MEELHSRPDRSRSDSSNIDPGYMLAQGRLKAKMTTEQVAEKLHLSARKVSALEGNDYKELPEAPYVRGYMRNYARLVGVSPGPLLEAYNKMTGVKKQPEVTTAPLQKNKAFDDSGLVKIVAVVTGIAVVALIIFMWPQRANEVSSPESYDSGSTEAGEAATQNLMESELFPPGIDETAGASSGNEGSADDTSNLSSMEVTMPGDTLSGPEPAASSNVFESNRSRITGNQTAPVFRQPAATVPATTATAPVVLEKKSEIILYVEEDSWADIRDSGNNKLIYETLTSGRVITLEGVPPFKVFLGNVKGVKLFYNGQEYDVAQHRRGLVARFRLGKGSQQ
jgi:cytoskeleton protein RodZ